VLKDRFFDGSVMDLLAGRLPFAPSSWMPDLHPTRPLATAWLRVFFPWENPFLALTFGFKKTLTSHPPQRYGLKVQGVALWRVFFGRHRKVA